MHARTGQRPQVEAGRLDHGFARGSQERGGGKAYLSAASLLFFSAFDKPSYRFIIAAEIPLGPSGPLRAPPTASLAAAFQSLLSMLAWHRRVTSVTV